MNILLVDDEDLSRRAVAAFLQNHLGHHVMEAGNGADALRLFREHPFQMVLTDIRMPEMDGIELLKALKALPEGRWADIIMMTGFADLGSSIQALRGGAYDYMRKPIDVEELAEIVARVAEHQSLLRENYELRHAFLEKVDEATKETQSKLKQLQTAYAEVMGVGRVGVFSTHMQEVIDLAHRLHSDRTVPVLIEGETGTGKEIIARLVHYGEGEITTPFITVNCSAITATLFESELFGYEGGAFTGSRRTGMAGKFEAAQKGSLFLDEIGDLPLDLQPKLLRVLQEREIYRVGGVKKIDLDVRIICATNQPLERLVEEGKFRRDLYYRLNMGKIHLPPLRDQQGAIAPMAQMFLEKFSEIKRKRYKYIDKAALELLNRHTWPGNVRELENAIERVLLLYDDEVIRPEHLSFLHSIEEKPAAAAPQGSRNTFMLSLSSAGMTLRAIDALIAKHVVEMCDGNKSHAATFLDISRTTLRSHLNYQG